MTNLHELQRFLDAASGIVGLAEPISANRPSPNVFSVLGVERSEVIQSRFIAWLLDPVAEHGTGSGFLGAFLEAAGLPRVADGCGPYEVITELGGADDEARTDIVVSCEPEFLIYVEHKIDAAEQPNQVDREHADLRRTGERLGVPIERQFAVFLTPEGRSPTSGDASPWRTVSHGDLADGFAGIAERVSDAHVERLVLDWVDVTRSWRGVHRVMSFTEQTTFLAQHYDHFRHLCDWAGDLARQLTSVAFSTASEFLVDDWRRDSGATPLWMTITRDCWRTPSGATTLALVVDGFTSQSLTGLAAWPQAYVWYSLSETTDEEGQRIQALAGEVRDALGRTAGLPGRRGEAQNRKIWLTELPKLISGDLDAYAQSLRADTEAFFGGCIGVLDGMDGQIRRVAHGNPEV